MKQGGLVLSLLPNPSKVGCSIAGLRFTGAFSDVLIHTVSITGNFKASPYLKEKHSSKFFLFVKIFCKRYLQVIRDERKVSERFLILDAKFSSVHPVNKGSQSGAVNFPRED